MADDGGEEDEDDDEEEVAASVERAFSVRIHPNVRQLSHGPVPDASGHRLAQSTFRSRSPVKAHLDKARSNSSLSCRRTGTALLDACILPPHAPRLA